MRGEVAELSQSLGDADLLDIKHHCHCLTSIQEEKAAGTRREGRK